MKRNDFLWGDWIKPIGAGLGISASMAVLLSIGTEPNGEIALCRDIADISTSFSLTFIGVLLTFYSLIQILAEKAWVQQRVAHTRYWSAFKANLIRLIQILAVLFLMSIGYIGVDDMFISSPEKNKVTSGNPNLVIEFIPSLFILLMSFLIGVALVRICMTAKTFINIITVEDAAE